MINIFGKTNKNKPDTFKIEDKRYTYKKCKKFNGIKLIKLQLTI